MTAARRARVAEAYGRVLEDTSVGLEGRHAGLLLDRGLKDSSPPAPGQATSAKAKLIGRVAGVTPDEVYRDAYARWRTMLERRANVEHRDLTVRGTLIVGLGGEGVLETGIALQRAYGMPVIPGSALKGLARRYVQGRLAPQAGETDEERAKFAPEGVYHETLFGHQKSASYITYHDAWWIPDSADRAANDASDGDRVQGPLAPDVITVHHPRYYTPRAGRREAPRDIDDPNPVSFIGARGCFFVAVEGPDASWARAAMEVLIAALGDLGAGAKTSAGYGRLFATATDAAGGATRMAEGAAAETLPAAATKLEVSEANETKVGEAQLAHREDGRTLKLTPITGDETAVSESTVTTDNIKELRPNTTSADVVGMSPDQGGSEVKEEETTPPVQPAQNGIDTAQVKKPVRAKILSVSKGGRRLKVQLLTVHREILDVDMPVIYGVAPLDSSAVGRVITLTVTEMERGNGQQPGRVTRVKA